MEDKEEQTPIHTTKPFLSSSLPKPKVGWSLDLDTDIYILLVQKRVCKNMSLYSNYRHTNT